MSLTALAHRIRAPLTAARLRPGDYLPEEQSFIVVAIVIGVLSGLSVVCFRIAIEWSRIQLLGSALQPSWPNVILAPTLAGLVVAVLTIHVFPRTRGSGVNQTKAALYIYDGEIPFSSVVGKFFNSILSIGSGHALGPEDPSLQIGAGLASALGRRLHLSRENSRLIAPVGAAAGLAAAFNTPITAVLFVIEEVIGRWSAGILGAVILAAVSSVVVERWFLGAEPLFRVPAYRLEDPWELLAYAVLGIVGGICSLAFVKLVTRLRARLLALPVWTRYLQPAAAGMLIGTLGLGFPQVMGAGYEHIDLAMHQRYLWTTLAALAVLKLLASSASFSSGGSGGLFAPTLFMGAMLGAMVGDLERVLFPGASVAVGAYALVGMGTLFAGVMRSPMTSVFMILEISGNYSIILPVMISNTIAYLISRTFQRTPLFDVLGRQDGLELPSLEEQREISVLRVEDAMRAPGLPVLDAAETIGAALSRLEAEHGSEAVVRFPAGAWGAVTAERLRAHGAEGRGLERLTALFEEARLPRVYPDQTLDVALRLMHHRPWLPVVHRAAAEELLGIVTVPDIVEAYRGEGLGPPGEAGE